MSLDVYALLVLGGTVIFATVSTLLFLRFAYRKEHRMFKNLKRTIYLLKTGGNSLQTEQGLLRDNGLFSVHATIFDLRTDTRSLQTLNRSTVLVVGYSKEFAEYQAVIDSARQRNLPIVVLAKPGEIVPAHMEIFQGYIYFEMCNTPSRLLTTILNLSLVSKPVS